MSVSERIQRISIDCNANLVSALKKMDELDKKLLLVFSGEKYIGLLSVGDIQRAIIRNVSLESKVEEILRKQNRVARPEDSKDSVRKLMIEFRTECMPVVDEENNLVDVYFWEDEFAESIVVDDSKLNIPVVIMAGGFGSRLKPLTNIIPKPLVPIGEKPIVEIIIDRFNKIGVSEFHLSVNYKHEMIRYYFDHLPEKNYSVSYFMEDKPLGTAGSIYLIKDILRSTFFVSNCDILIDQDYRDIYKYHVESRNEITLVGSLKHYKIPYGTLETGEGGQLLSMREKPEITYMINSGMYVLEPSVLKDIPDNTFFHITELIEKVKARGGKVGVFPVSEKSWFDIGEWNQYQQTLKSFEQRMKNNG
jgi:dTDP-glucose pyrophosphorylase